MFFTIDFDLQMYRQRCYTIGLNSENQSIVISFLFDFRLSKERESLSDMIVCFLYRFSLDLY